MTPRTLPRGVTLVGLLLAVAAVLMDREVVALLSPLIGAHAAAKLAAAGAVLAAFGRALGDQAAKAPAPPPTTEHDG